MKYLKQLVLAFALIFCFSCLANQSGNEEKISIAFSPSQEHIISGKVIDKVTGEPIPFCNVALKSSSIGTATNEIGEFILYVDELPANLVFSHLNYSQFSIEVSEASTLIVSLIPLTTALQEVVVLASKKDVLALELAKKAFQKAENSSRTDYHGRAFYRQKSKNGDSYSEFSEIFYDIRYNTNGIKDWNIIEGRYALKDDEIYNRNFTIFSRILKPLQPNTSELIFPLHPEFEVHYQLNILEIINSEDSQIALVRFKPLQADSTPTFRGEVYIDMKTYDILKIKGELSRDDLNLVKLTTKEGSWKDYTISYDINYKRDSLSKTLLDYIKIDQAFDYYINDSLQYRSSTTSNLTFYEHYTSTSRKRLGGRLRTNMSDWKKLDEIGYNEKFWANNPIVKRTPVEEDVISSFEKKNAFSSIFLNSAENIALMTSNISADPLILELGNKMSSYTNDHPIEKVFLHTDKDLFSAGETLWYSAYVVLGSYNQYSNASKILHVDLINPKNEIVKSQTHELVNGRSVGSLKLPKNIQSGTYQLRSYTQWMRNFSSDFFFTKNLEILSAETKPENLKIDDTKIDLQFFPEGGYLVEDVPSKVAFKAIGNDGSNKTIKGRILNTAGQQVTTFGTLDRGAGFFQLLPSKGEQYIAVLDNGQKYPLPSAIPKGYTLTAENLNDKAIKLKVQASNSLRNSPFYIVAYLNQRKYYQAKFEFRKNDVIRFEIPKTKMPSGVLTITLFDENKKPWCERPVFVNNQEELVIKTNISEHKLTKREAISLKVNITDTNGRPVSTDFSVAVTDAKQVLKEDGASNILTHLLLESDIKGRIHNPGLLFKDQKRATLNALDLVMLTHNWRKFSWLELWNENSQKGIFNFSKGLLISGTAFNLSEKPLSNTTLRIIAKSDAYLNMFSAKTSEEGKFEIPNFNFSNNTQLVFNALNSSERPIDVKIELDDNAINLPISNHDRAIVQVNEKSEEYGRYSGARTKMDSIYSYNKTTLLDEVTVVADKKERLSETPSLYGFLPDITIYPEDRGPLIDIFQLLRGLPGLQVTGSGFDTQVGIRSGGSPLWIVDGVPITDGNAIPVNVASVANAGGGSDENSQPPPGITGSRGGTVNSSGLGGDDPDPASRRATAPVPDFVKSIDVGAIEKIEVHKGASSGGISGLRGQSGVIIIYTKKVIKKVVSPTFDIFGHAVEREFYSPKYTVPQSKHNTPDYRATLYWNPNMRTDANGNASVSFFNSDIAKKIQIAIEALSNDGLPGTYIKTFGELE